ncbi:MAG TPA: pilin [Candidatus Saccharimonadales bacterium]|nr:pilin [Candidatus Saccharimonadales bacterium]
MFKKIKKHISTAVASIVLALSLGTGVAMAQHVSGGVCTGSNLKFTTSNATAGTGCADPSFANQDAKVNNIIALVINIFSIIVGVIAVIMIVYGGFRYITSGGDTTKVTASRNTILYAIIGLIIVALAQFIVKFVLQKAINSTNAS